MRILDEIIVRIRPEFIPGARAHCRVTVTLNGGMTHNFERMLRQEWFESEFHRLMVMAEEEMVEIAKKESESDEHTNERKEVPSPRSRPTGEGLHPGFGE